MNKTRNAELLKIKEAAKEMKEAVETMFEKIDLPELEQLANDVQGVGDDAESRYRKDEEDLDTDDEDAEERMNAVETVKGELGAVADGLVEIGKFLESLEEKWEEIEQALEEALEK